VPRRSAARRAASADVRQNDAVTSTFPHARKGELGYDIDEVEQFLEQARVAYTGDHPDREPLSSVRIRDTAFSMRRGGYSTSHVDAALERLEDAFSARERDRAIADEGDEAWYGEAREAAQVVLDRLVRPPSRRFRRVPFFVSGYSVREVDELADRVTAFFRSGGALSVEEVRTAAFRPQRGGYDELQVDAVLDAVISTILAVR
jgi:DivIVA domain-containing protein